MGMGKRSGSTGSWKSQLWWEWSRWVTLCGSSSWWSGWVIRCGSATQPRSGPAMCASRRQARCRPYSEAVAGEPVPPYLGAVAPTTGSAAVTDPPSQAGRDAYPHQDRVATRGVEPGDAEEAHLVE